MSARGEFRISITKEDLVFAAAHFITFAGHRCETLHGHNYRASVTLQGALEADTWYVADFAVVKQIMRRLTGELDHKVLLPTQSPIVAVERDGARVTVAVSGEPRYLFPDRDCVLLPIPNTTVEMLARHLAGRLHQELTAAGVKHLQLMEMEVEENFGQSATYRETL
jgi:6-pyruvoyltetrahydropterin/6-carboxytetrahydropterin synthase